MGKILSDAFNLKLTPNTLDCYGLRVPKRNAALPWAAARDDAADK